MNTETFTIEDKETVLKKWGHETIIANGPDYCGKLLNIKADNELGAHFHVIKKETFYLISGDVTVTLRDPLTRVNTSLSLSEGKSLTINPGCVHSVFAHKDSVIMEVSTQHFDSDSYRV